MLAGAGMLLVDGANPLVAKNQLNHNGTEGLRCEGSSNGKLERNTIQRNGGPGIFAAAGCEPVIGENFVHSNNGELDEDEDGEDGRDNASAVPAD